MKTLTKLSMLSVVLMLGAQACAMENSGGMSVNQAYTYLRNFFPLTDTKEIRGLEQLRPCDVARAFWTAVEGNEDNDQIRIPAYQAASIILKDMDINTDLLESKPVENDTQKDSLPAGTNPKRKNTYFHAKIAAGCITSISLIGLTTYIFRNQLYSLFDARIKPVINPIFSYVTSKTPNFIKNIWSK